MNTHDPLAALRVIADRARQNIAHAKGEPAHIILTLRRTREPGHGANVFIAGLGSPKGRVVGSHEAGVYIIDCCAYEVLAYCEKAIERFDLSSMPRKSSTP